MSPSDQRSDQSISPGLREARPTRPTRGLYADCSNLYYTIRARWGAKLSYAELVNFFGAIDEKVAYCPDTKESIPFVRSLEGAGWKVKRRRPRGTGESQTCNMSTDLTVDVLGSKHATIILATANGDLAPLVDSLIKAGRKCIVVGCGVSRELSSLATATIEVPPSMFQRTGPIEL